jgi:hypothetical protein
MNSSINYYIEKLTKDIETNTSKKMSTKKERTSKEQLKQILHNEINNYFNDKGYKLLITLDNITAKNQPLQYICCCGAEKHKAFKEILSRNCRECKNKKLTEVSTNFSVCPTDNPDEKWISIEGGFISNKGRACNVFGKLLTMEERGRYFINGKLQYITILMATAFKINNYHLLNDNESKYIVRNIGNQSSVPILENIKIGTRDEIGRENGQLARKSDQFKEKMQMDLVKHLEKFKYQTLEELPNHLIFEDGNIYNNNKGTGNNRFLTFSKTSKKFKSNQYYILNTTDKTYKVHRLVCYAFHPIEGKTKLEDYSDLQVNHIDGNTLNNHKDNLEWSTKSQNMQHAYNTGLNKKVRAILQYDLDNNFIAEFESIAKAARETKFAEHQIREVAKGRAKPTEYIWKYKDESKNEEFSKKYASKLKNNKRKIEVELVFED